MPNQESIVFLLLGGNLKNPAETFIKARKALEHKVGVIIKQSRLYSSTPWGFKHENNFLNQVLQIKTSLSPYEVLSCCLEIEKGLGRKRTSSNQWNARIIDIDLLFYNSMMLQEDALTIPHPRIHERKFTLVPLAEVAPDYIHPKLKISVLKMLLQCKDKGEVQVAKTLEV